MERRTDRDGAPAGPEARIRAEIQTEGSIGFDRFMELALYGVGGFFERPPVGADAHFVTSPHVSPFVFSRSVRATILDAWLALGEPNPLRVVELGAGDGTLASALVESFAELPAPALEYAGVEISSGARAALIERGLDTVPSLERLEPFEGVVVANELLDNLPFLLARRDGDAVLELRVTVDGAGALTSEPEPWTDERVPADDLHLAPGEIGTAPVGAFALIDALAARLRRGYAILVDYGKRGPAGAPRGYERHRAVADVLGHQPGSSDVTAGVDLDLIARRARTAGLRAWDPVRQRDALAALGYRSWDDTMREEQARLQRDGDRSDATRVWETRSRASLLVEPSGLGGHWWLTLATSGLPEPAWLARAREESLPAD